MFKNTHVHTTNAKPSTMKNERKIGVYRKQIYLYYLPILEKNITELINLEKICVVIIIIRVIAQVILVFSRDSALLLKCIASCRVMQRKKKLN